MYYISVDIGGTFTDCVLMDGSGTIKAFKSESRPLHPAEGVLGVLKEASASLNIPVSKLLAETRLFTHGTTISTNTIITLGGVKTGLITTRGFKDNYHMARMGRGETRDVSKVGRPASLVQRADTHEVTERVD